MFKIKVAGLNILVKNKYRYSEILCNNYFTKEDHTDFEVFASDSDIEEEIKTSDISVTPEYAESVCIHREIAERLAEYDAFLLHSALIECDRVGVAFAAHSGVGKSTHISLWQKNFGDRVKIVNGDKPIVRFVDGEIRAYGTPWLGKEDLGENTYCILKAMCFIGRGETNKIRKLPAEVAVMPMFEQIYLPKKGENTAKTLELADRFASQVSFFQLACNMEDEAAIVSYNAIIKGEV